MKAQIEELKGIRRTIDGSACMLTYVLADHWHYNFIAAMCVVGMIAQVLMAIMEAYKSDVENQIKEKKNEQG